MMISSLLALVSTAMSMDGRVGEPVVTNGWATTSRTSGTVEFTIAVKQQNIDQLKAIALKVIL